jgi:hypothetical protein
VLPSADYQLGIRFSIHPPGAHILWEDLPDPAVCIELAGGIGPCKRGQKRECLWILWTFDRSLLEWREIARAAAVNWEWTLTLRQPAIRALHPEPKFVNLLKESRDRADEFVAEMDRRLATMPEDLRKSVLARVMDQVTGRLANV